MARLSGSFLALALWAQIACAATVGPVGDLVISNATVTLDGTSRAAVLAGGTFPGTLVTGNKGDNFLFDKRNKLASTSIHWHGIFQTGTASADGPAFVTQCPIAHGNSFLYDFNVNQAGTFWYHSHLSTQYCDGLRGPMVIYDPEDPYLDLYDVDDESTVLTLADWYHTVAKLETGAPPPNSALIQGLGRTSSTLTAPLGVLTVTQGLRYRIRLINIACDPNYSKCNSSRLRMYLTLSRADGITTTPYNVDSIQIYVGQRYSFILTANQTVDNYWIRANPSGGPTGFAGGINSGILRYVGAADADPTTTQTTSVNPFNEVNLHPLVNPGAPGQPVAGGVDVAMNLILTNSGGKFLINGVSFVPPTTPVLLQILSGAETAASLLPAGSVYPLPSNSTIELSLPGGVVGGGHPFHLHGHAFDVVRSAGSTVYNYANPARRDVVNIGVAGDNVTIRFATDNAGPWFLHCHIDWHLESGFAIVFAEDTADWDADIAHSAAWDDLCPIYNALNATDL
ncbi:Laccase lcc5 [Mycena sanguinolenta]|uniref:laccase n=1 Tax=Mycena sanguinolenta TaxID=230812 RepID=A0A8H6ZEA8_9AGAR|nr:Laccase lcc5 [Mycena sanguinolenta]